MTMQRRRMVGAWEAAGAEDEIAGLDSTLAAEWLRNGLLVFVTCISTSHLQWSDQR